MKRPDEGLFANLAEGVAHYAALGFRHFDSEDDWVTMRGNVSEAWIRPARPGSFPGWIGSVVPTPDESPSPKAKEVL